MKILFFHNTMPDYRIPFFKGLNEKIEIDYIFTKMDLSERIYGNKLEYDQVKELNYMLLSSNIKRYTEILKYIGCKNYTGIVLPPLDSFSDFLDAFLIVIMCKIYKIKLFYFGEKWEAPFEKQPFKKKIKNSIQRKAFKVILFFVDRCIVSGTKSREYFESIGVIPNKISVAIDASGVTFCNSKKINIKEELKFEANDKIILYYGRIIERKGLDILIKAYEKLLVSNSSISLLICGDGDFSLQCKKLVQELDLKKVVFTGAISPIDRYTYFSQCDLFVLPSYFHKGIPEAWGLTVNEALQCGTPVIATNAVGAAFDLLDGNNGVMVEENNVNELTNAIDELLNRTDKEGMKLSCINTYNRYDYANMVNSFIDAFYKV